MTRQWDVHECIVFFKTREAWDGLSNMAAGFPIEFGKDVFPSSEHLYQDCRFPHHRDVQGAIIAEKNPLKAKWISRANNEKTRHGWDFIREQVMYWAITLKAAQHESFRVLLLNTGHRPIVEKSSKDNFWGAMQTSDPDILVGQNVLGSLLVQLRADVFDYSIGRCELPPAPMLNTNYLTD